MAEVQTVELLSVLRDIVFIVLIPLSAWIILRINSFDTRLAKIETILSESLPILNKAFSDRLSEVNRRLEKIEGEIEHMRETKKTTYTYNMSKND